VFSFVNIYMENTNTQLTINDIALTRDVIDLACKRGAFSGAEARQVGTLFEKIDQFVRAALAQAEAEKQAEAGTVPESAVSPETQGE
jgi:hypothetical protein